MTDRDAVRVEHHPIARILMTEEAIYGLILVSGMIVVSRSLSSTSIHAFTTVLVTVLVFYAAHVYAGTLGRLAITDGQAGLRHSIIGAARQSSGMLIASLAPLLVLLLGVVGVLDDIAALWTALIVNTVLLGAFGWAAVARWSTHWVARLVGALISSTFGVILILLKAFVHH